MKWTKIITALLMITFFTSCVIAPPKEKEQDTKPLPMPSLPAPLSPSLPSPSGSFGALRWKHSKWDESLKTEIAARFEQLDKVGDDFQRFCPKYKALTRDGKINAFATFFVALARPESDFNENCYTPDDVGGTASVGLYQFSYEDKSWITWCVFDRKNKSLQDPINNIKCAVGEFARLVTEDGVITKGCNDSSARGGARYWSTLRDDECGNPDYHALDEILAESNKGPGCL